MEVSKEYKEEDKENFGIFPIDFALGGCKESLGLAKHKVARHSEREKSKSQPKGGKDKSGSTANNNNNSADEREESDTKQLPTANDYFRAGHSLDYDRKTDQLLVFGGYNGPNELYVLHNASYLTEVDYTKREKMYWEKVKLTGINGRAGHTSFICGSQLFVYGGYNDNSQVYEDMFSVDIASGTFDVSLVEYKRFASLNLDRRWHCSQFITKSNRMLVHGGWNITGPLGDTLVFNLETSKWEQVSLPDAPSPRRWHSLTELPNQRYLIYGGYNGDIHTPLKDFHLLDLERQKWIKPHMNGSIPGNRNRHTLTPLEQTSDKSYVLLGGYEKDKLFNRNVYILHTDDMSWTCIDASSIGELYPIVRAAHRVTHISNDGLVVAGGVFRDFIEPFYCMDARMIKNRMS